MQELSAYLLEARNLSAEQFAERSSAISNYIAEWLTQKGVTDPTKDSGTFDSLTMNGNGNFRARKNLPM